MPDAISLTPTSMIPAEKSKLESSSHSNTPYDFTVAVVQSTVLLAISTKVIESSTPTPLTVAWMVDPDTEIILVES